MQDLGKLVKVTFCFENLEDLTLSGDTIKRLDFGNIEQRMALGFDSQKQRLIQSKHYETNYISLDIDKEEAIKYLIKSGKENAAYELKRLQRYLDIVDIMLTYEATDGHEYSMDIYVPYISTNSDDNVLETVTFVNANTQYERNKEAIKTLNIKLDFKESDFVDILSIKIGPKKD